MKRIIVALAVMASAFLAGSGRVHAQAAGTKVAIVNVGQVFSKYEKAKFYKDEMERLLKPYKDKGEAIKAEMTKYGQILKEKRKQMDDKTVAAYESFLINKKREMEDLDLEARKQVGKRQEDQIVTLYKELAGSVQAYASANQIQLVLGYGEQIEGDLFSILNIQRKMSGMDMGSTTPLFLGIGVDISEAIITTLNTHYRANAGPATVPGTTTSNQKK